MVMPRSTLSWMAVVVLSALITACSSNENGQPQPQQDDNRDTIWDLFSGREDPSVTVRVNRYIWNASIEVLDFLPLESADPFSGIIVTGWGRPPNGATEYRATVLVRDPALAARSLSLSMTTRSGPVDSSIIESVENAIFTRARQLRQADERL